MRISIFGASGRVGTQLVELVLASPGLELVAALVSPTSRHVGQPVAGGALEYRPAEAAMNTRCDVIIDFSAPAASLWLQEQIGRSPLPCVIGTTGFSKAQEDQLTGWSAHRPMVISANFALGFEAFRQCAARFASTMPGAEATVREVYHARKKAEPSGTSRWLAETVRKARSKAMGFAASEPDITVNREGDVTGINEVRFDLGSAGLTLTYQVHTLAAYAEGAMAAASWLRTARPDCGRYTLADTQTT